MPVLPEETNEKFQSKHLGIGVGERNWDPQDTLPLCQDCTRSFLISRGIYSSFLPSFPIIAMRRRWEGRGKREAIGSGVRGRALGLPGVPPLLCPPPSRLEVRGAGPAGAGGRIPALGKSPRGAGWGAAASPASERQPGEGGENTKARKQAAIPACNFIRYVVAEAIIVFSELKSERR